MSKTKIIAMHWLIALCVSSHAFSEGRYVAKNNSDIANIIQNMGDKVSTDPWHFTNLYDPSSDSFFIPYHLWSGAKWNGDKSVDKCVHNVRSTWHHLNPRNKQVKSKIIGPKKFEHPSSGQVLETYEWKSKRGSQYLICHEKGLARIYDFKFDKAGLLDSPVLNGTECKFPAGFGWRLGSPEDCNPQAPKQTTLTELIFDNDYNLTKIAYTYTVKAGFSARAADDYYEYVVGKGRVLHKKLK
ncbi:MAG: hypothetical protein L7U49_07435 [Litoricolaceae bacterium]|nr:hypothetical protein [Litorivicinaceae bacterium]